MPLFGTGWAAGQVVMPNRVKRGVNMVEDSKSLPTRVSPDRRFGLRLWWSKLRWDGLPGNQSGKLLTSHLGK
jgi:hypothetical protein